MRWSNLFCVALLGLIATGSAFAGDTAPTLNGQVNFTADSRMILPATGERTRSGSPEDRACFMMRTYRVRKNMDRDSVIPATPDQAAFNPDDIVGYSTCQKASKFGVKSTQ